MHEHNTLHEMQNEKLKKGLWCQLTTVLMGVALWDDLVHSSGLAEKQHGRPQNDAARTNEHDIVILPTAFYTEL